MLSARFICEAFGGLLFWQPDSMVIPNAVAKGYRPQLPKKCAAGSTAILELCWASDAALRPEFDEVRLWLPTIGPLLAIAFRLSAP